MKVLILFLILGLPWICGLILVILALILPKTWVGKAFAMVITIGLIYIDRYYIYPKFGESGSNFLHLNVRFFVFHFVLLFIIPLSVSWGKEFGKPSLVLLSAVTGAFLVFLCVGIQR